MFVRKEKSESLDDDRTIWKAEDGRKGISGFLPQSSTLVQVVTQQPLSITITEVKNPWRAVPISVNLQRFVANAITPTEQLFTEQDMAMLEARPWPRSRCESDRLSDEIATTELLSPKNARRSQKDIM